MISVRASDPRDPDATELLQASHHYLTNLEYPDTAQHHLSIEALCVPSIQFFVADLNGIAIGCGALANQGDYGEIKSMYVDPKIRRSGAATALMTKLEKAARAANLPCLRLETGHDMVDAIGLYQRHGFEIRAAYGAYRADPLSTFMEKAL